MQTFFKIQKNTYIDSLETLFMMSVLNNQKGVEIAFAGMAVPALLADLEKNNLLIEEVKALKSSDFLVVARCDSQEVFNTAVLEAEKQCKWTDEDKIDRCNDIKKAVSICPSANLCQIEVPGEYALEEVTKALNLGLHCCVFSNNVPLKDERKMKELAVEKGLLCMGPDCGVANINGAALVLASINNRGPFGICGASGTGIQHVAAILHEYGSGVSQTIGTGGNDLKPEVGGLMMQMGLAALEADPETKYIVLISRKPGEGVLEVLLEKIKACTKPIVVFFMGCDRAQIEACGGIYAANLDDCADKALSLIGKTFQPETEEELEKLAQTAVDGMKSSQKYLRGMYTGGTYMDEAMRTMEKVIGPVWSNAPLASQYKLEDSYKSLENTCVDYGEEEFTLGKPHPAIDPSVRKREIMREAQDEEVAVIVLDFILTPPGHSDPAGDVIPEIEKAVEKAKEQGRKLVFIASVLGTSADLQNKTAQENKLKAAGVIVCRTNNSASKLAALIVKKQGEKHV